MSKFDAAIKCLKEDSRFEFAPGKPSSDPVIDESIHSAIRVLEAAGMMSKERHLTHFVEETSHVKCYYCTAIRALLAALPEVKK